MSRRKQLNPKPLNKGDCSDMTAEDMTVDSRDPKDFNIKDDNAINIERHSNTSNTPSPSSISLPWNSDDINMAADTNSAIKRNSTITNENKTFRHKLNDEESFELHDVKEEIKIESSNSSEQGDTSPAELNASNSNISNGEDIRTEATNNDQSEILLSSPSESLIKVMEERQQIIRPSTPKNSCNLPKLRLNTLLASDPALKPDAKDLKLIQEEANNQRRKIHLLHSISRTDELDTLMENTVNKLTVEKIAKPVPSTMEVVAPPPPPPHHRMKVFMCLPCGIGFSSPSTLEAHQTYYCSHRHKDTEETTIQTSSAIEKTATSSATIAVNSSYTVQNQVNSEPATKAHKTGKQYACTQCSYSADKKVSLNRHMRIHQASPASTANTNATTNNTTSINVQIDESSSQQIDRYCSDCDIRFNNVKTYRAHKQHYCNSRRADGPLTPKLEVPNSPHSNKHLNPTSSSGSTITSPQNRTKTPVPSTILTAATAAAINATNTPSSSPFLLLPTNPVLIIPYSLIRNGSLISGPTTFTALGAMNPDATCFALENGNLKSIASAVHIGHTLDNTSSTINVKNCKNLSDENAQGQCIPSNNNDVMAINDKILKYNTEDSRSSTPKSAKEKTNRESAPLDLSLRRSPIERVLQQPQRQRQHINSDTIDHLNSDQCHHLDRSDAIPCTMDRDNLSHDESDSITPEQIVCAPSLPSSPTMTPSPCRKTISPRSSGACSNSSISPPASAAISINTLNNSATTTASLLDNLQFRSMLPADLLNPILTKQNLELALKLSVAAAAVNSSTAGSIGSHNSTSAELAVAAAAAAAATGRAQLLGLPVLQSTVTTPSTGATVPSNSQPQIYVKQGVSKCKECNIVFCKYENYLAHKQHYCSARNQDLSDIEVKTSPSSPMVGSTSSGENVTPVAYQQLICAACGIKYTSLDNLRAHQNYYCPKGVAATTVTPSAAASTMVTADQLPIITKEKCAKCSTIHEPTLPCPMPAILQQQPQQQVHHHHQQHAASFISPSNQNVYKCPLCDMISLTATESRKHMETHGTVKAFRCTICGYKGNTLRGMRTHIRMHVDKKTTIDFNEEHYMTCILEDDNTETVATTTTTTIASAAKDQLAKQQHSQQTIVGAVDLQQQIFNCDLCSYSSTYKGNVLRHMKLLHPHIVTHSPSLSPDESGSVSGPDPNETSSLTNSHNGDNSFHGCTVKTEPLENTNQPNQLGNFMHNVRKVDNNSTFLSKVGQQHLPTSSNDNLSIMPNIKTEPIELATIERSTASPPTNNSLRSSVVLPPSLHTQSPSLLEDNFNQKYCQSCDISFNYLKTYLAHKQFYCKNKIKLTDCNDNPSPNALTISNTDNITLSSSSSSMPSPTTDITIQKSKDGIQEAAI